MEGVVYLTDTAATILAVGQPNWSLFAAENGVSWLTAEAVIGASLLEAITGDKVGDAYRRMHRAVATGRRTETDVYKRQR